MIIKKKEKEKKKKDELDHKTIFDCGVHLLIQKWSQIPSMKRFVDYFTDQ